MLASHVLTATVLAVAIGSAAWTITKATITTPLRVLLARKEGWFWGKLFELSRCPYCVSHWLAFFAVLFWRPWLVSGWVVGQFLVTSFAIIALSSLVILVIRKALT